jgi:hypothetical protein
MHVFTNAQYSQCNFYVTARLHQLTLDQFVNLISTHEYVNAQICQHSLLLSTPLHWLLGYVSRDVITSSMRPIT